MSSAANAPTERELFWMSASAFVARGIVGLVAWRLSPLLARVSTPPHSVSTGGTREDLYASAAFLVGLWLIAVSAPGLLFEAYAATRPGTLAYPEAHPQVPLLLFQCVLGISFVRNRWLIRWALHETGRSAVNEASDAVQHEADGA
jgi:hypothetical protein